jgi:hypothetical protein
MPLRPGRRSAAGIDTSGGRRSARFWTLNAMLAFRLLLHQYLEGGGEGALDALLHLAKRRDRRFVEV